MSGKRKANEMSPSSEQPEKQLSKKAKLKLARERAAQFAQRDKQKIQSQRAKKYGTPAPKTSPASKTKATKAETPPAKKSPEKKLTLSERKKIAMQNAKEFAARDKAGLQSKKKAVAAVASSTTMETDDSPPSPIPETHPKKQSFGSAIDPSQVAAFEEMRQRLMQQNGPSKSDDSEEVDEEDDIPAPPPALMAQVSTQVLLNAKRGLVDDSNSVSTEEKEEAIVVENGDFRFVNGSDQPVEAEKPKSRWLPKIAAVIIAALILVPALAIFSMIIMLPAETTQSRLPAPEKVTATKTMCYFNSDPEYEETCSNGIPCPKGGSCVGGKLVHCDNAFQEISDNGDKCVLGENYVPMKDTLIDLLSSYASQICDHSSKPTFKYTMLQKDEPTVLEEESEDLVEVLKDEGFVVYERDNDLYVGLPETFKVSLPLYCHLGNIGQWVLQEAGMLLLGIMMFAGSNLFGFVTSYPIPAAVIALVLFILSKLRQYRATKRKRREDIVQTRKIAYKTLQESCGVEHCATHIRDEIAMALYPDSKKLRLDLAKYVWPKIVDDVKRDTRVRKFQTLTRDGKTRDMWQWTAASKTPSQS